MNDIKNIMVALDLTDMDDILIDYASYIAEILDAEKVFFVHNIKKYEISELFEEQLKGFNLDQAIGDELNEKVENRFKAQVEWEVLISEDPYTESLLKYVVNKYAVQLTILGNKNKLKGTGVVSSKLLRLLKCDILSVPENATPKINNIWVGVDFSHSSQKLFKITEKLQKATQASLTAAHVYNVPVQFSPYLPKETVAPKIEKHIQEKSRKFFAKLKYPQKMETQIIPGREASAAEKLASSAKKDGANLLIVTDKGANTFSSLLIGSVTEELFSGIIETPLWVKK